MAETGGGSVWRARHYKPYRSNLSRRNEDQAWRHVYRQKQDTRCVSDGKSRRRVLGFIKVLGCFGELRGPTSRHVLHGAIRSGMLEERRLSMSEA